MHAVTLPPAQRSPERPILEPRKGEQFWWEVNGTFNPGATEYQGQVILLYRAYDLFRISRLGIAISPDGINFQQEDTPAIDSDPNNPYERLGIEDPRITKIDETYYIVHTASSYYEIGHAPDVTSPSSLNMIPWRVRIAIKKTKDFKVFEIAGDLIDVPAKNGILLPEKIENEFVLYYRQNKELKMSFSPDLKRWHDTKTISWPQLNNWDVNKFGTGSQLLKTSQGYLMVYHFVDDKQTYRLGLLMLSLSDPSEILWYSQPILEPEQLYEKNGFVSNVVYCCGAIIKKNQLWIYYGAADRVIGRAIWSLENLPKL